MKSQSAPTAAKHPDLPLTPSCYLDPDQLAHLTKSVRRGFLTGKREQSLLRRIAFAHQILDKKEEQVILESYYMTPVKALCDKYDLFTLTYRQLRQTILLGPAPGMSTPERLQKQIRDLYYSDYRAPRRHSPEDPPLPADIVDELEKDFFILAEEARKIVIPRILRFQAKNFLAGTRVENNWEERFFTLMKPDPLSPRYPANVLPVSLIERGMPADAAFQGLWLIGKGPETHADIESMLENTLFRDETPIEHIVALVSTIDHENAPAKDCCNYFHGTTHARMTFGRFQLKIIRQTPPSRNADSVYVRFELQVTRDNDPPRSLFVHWFNTPDGNTPLISHEHDGSLGALYELAFHTPRLFIHCKAGYGRSGYFLLTCLLARQWKMIFSQSSIHATAENILALLAELRLSRPGLVLTKTQLTAAITDAVRLYSLYRAHTLQKPKEDASDDSATEAPLSDLESDLENDWIDVKKQPWTASPAVLLPTPRHKKKPESAPKKSGLLWGLF